MKDLSVSRSDLEAASAEGYVEHKHLEALWGYLQERSKAKQPSEPAVKQSFDLSLSHVSWYGGAILMLLAGSWLTWRVWEAFGSAGLLGTTLIYAIALAVAGTRLWRSTNFKVSGGIFVTLAVALVPVIVYSIEHLCGFWSSFWPGRTAEALLMLGMQFSTVAAGVIAARYVRFPFLALPVVLALEAALFTIIMQVALPSTIAMTMQTKIAMGIGILIVIASIMVDRLLAEDFAVWGYLAGALTFWIGLTILAFDSLTEMQLIGYAVVNALMLLTSVFLSRRIFLVLGSFGILGYLFHLAYTVFAGSPMFPVVLTVIGIGFILLGNFYHKHRLAVDNLVKSFLPEGLQDWLPRTRS